MASRVLDHLPAIGFVVFVTALLLVGSRHEAWFDEAQAWLIARDASPWEIVSRYARYEGSPPLWHLALWAPAHLGFPYRGLWLISGACAGVGAWLVLFRSPFPVPMRLGIVFAYFFAFQYGIVARSYSLDLVFFPLAACLFADRLEKPLAYGAVVGLLANTNTHCFLFSGVMALEFLAAALRERRLFDRRVLAGVLIYGLFALFALASAWPPRDVSFDTYSASYLSVLRAIVLMAEPFVDRWDVLSPQPPDTVARAIGMAATIMLIRWSIILFSKARTAGLFFGLFAAFLAFTAAKYGQPWHSGLLFLVWVFVLWGSWPKVADLSPGDRKGLAFSLVVILGLQDVYTMAAWAREVVQPYAPGQAVARALADYGRTHPGSSVGALGAKSFVVQPWARGNLFSNYNAHAARPAFYDWRTSQPLLRDPTLADWSRLVAGGADNVLLLSAFQPIAPADMARYSAIAANSHYCARTFPGDMIWKTYNFETEQVTMFYRCPR